MRQTNSIHSHLQHQCHIFLMVLRAQRIAHLTPILMTANALKRQMFSIQEKTFIRVDPVKTKSQRLCNTIYHLTIPEKSHFRLIKERILTTIPQMRLIDFKCKFLLHYFVSRKIHILCSFFHHPLTI